MTLTSVAPISRFATSSGKLKDLGFVLSKLSLLAEGNLAGRPRQLAKIQIFAR